MFVYQSPQRNYLRAALANLQLYLACCLLCKVILSWVYKIKGQHSLDEDRSNAKMVIKKKIMDPSMGMLLVWLCDDLYMGNFLLMACAGHDKGGFLW